MELFSYIPPHRGGGSGGKSADLGDIKLLRRLSDFQIGRAEIVSPLTDTVRFIHHKDLRRAAAQKFFEKLHTEALRRHIEQLERAVFGGIKDLPLFSKRDHTVDAPGRDPFGIESIGLIFHQGDEGGNDDAVSRRHQHRELITQRFPGAGGHDDAKLLTGSDPFNDLLLVVKKPVVTEILFQSFKGIHGAGESSLITEL